MKGLKINSDVIFQAQSLLRDRLCAKCLPPSMLGYDSERSRLLDLIKRTADVGESNSVLVIGTRGSGKTMLLKSILTELHQHANIVENLMEVHLNGLLQTDDKIALKEITRQLQLENSVGDKVFGSFAENLQFLLDALKSGGQESKSILFVLDEFDMFAHHKNQTLLYNLFDIAQSAQAPICVVGLTARLDVLELLEKRVKSRFSHRQLHLLPKYELQDYVKMFVSYLSLPDDLPDQDYVMEFNARVKEISEDVAILDILKRLFLINKDIYRLNQFMLLPVCRLSVEHPYLESVSFIESSKCLSMDAKAAMLHGVSVLEMCLIIAMKHLTETYDGEPFNFEMVFNEYQKFCQRRSSMTKFEKPVVLKAFEHLCSLELVKPFDNSTKIQPEYRQMVLLVDGTQVTDAMHKYPNCPTEIKQWAASSFESHK